MVLKRVRECVACKLATLISIQYGMCVPMGDRIFHCLAAKSTQWSWTVSK